MGLYGNKFNQEYFEEQLIQEMGFSKKDLQDPKTVEKVLKQKQKYESIVNFVSILCIILVIIGSIITIGIGFIPLMLLFTTIYTTIESYPAKKNDKNLVKLKDKCLNLKQKCEYELEKNPDNKDNVKIKEMISNIDKCINAVDDYYKRISDENFLKQINSYCIILKNIIRFMEGKGLPNPSDLYFEYKDFFTILLKYYNISESNILQKMSKLEPNSYPDNIYGSFDELDLDGDVFKKIPIFKDKLNYGKKSLVVIIAHDEFAVIYYNGKLYETISTDINYCKEVTISKWIKNSDLPAKPDKAFIEADKSLGFYTFSDCPEQVKKREFPK